MRVSFKMLDDDVPEGLGFRTYSTVSAVVQGWVREDGLVYAVVLTNDLELFQVEMGDLRVLEA